MQVAAKEQALEQAGQDAGNEVDELQQLYAAVQQQRQIQGYHLTHVSLRMRQPLAGSPLVRGSPHAYKFSSSWALLAPLPVPVAMALLQTLMWHVQWIAVSLRTFDVLQASSTQGILSAPSE